MRSGCCPKDQVIVSNILGLFKMEAALTQDIVSQKMNLNEPRLLILERVVVRAFGLEDQEVCV